MAKNLKDIVDEGFSQLDALAEKRMEILSRAEKIGSAASGVQGAEAELKLKEAEEQYLPEMNSRVEELVQELRQALVQVADNNTGLQSGLKNSLKLHICEKLAEMSRTKSQLLSGAGDRLDVLLQQLETEFRSDRRILGSEVSRLLSELESWSLGSQAVLRQSQTETALRLSLSEYELSAELGRAFNQIVQGSETKRLEVGEFLDSLYHRQVEKLESCTADLNLRVTPIIREQREKMTDLCVACEKVLNQMRDTAFSGANSEAQGLSAGPLAELEKRHHNLQQELTDKYDELNRLSTSLLKQEEEFLHDKNTGIAGKADRIYSSLSKIDMSAGGIGQSKIEDAFTQVSVELMGLADDLGTKLRDLLHSQSEGLARLSHSMDKSFADLFVEFKGQLDKLVKAQDELCAKEEEELFLYLKRLEEQIDEAYSLRGAASGSPVQKDSKGAGGGR
jgi:hypothetical protein